MYPDVSVVLISWTPTRLRVKRFIQSLNSLKAHTERPHRLVVVDNSPSIQGDIIANANPDFHIINEINQGVGKSRNQGAALTDTPYIAFVDNDVGYFDGWLTACIKALKKYSDRKLIASFVKNKPMGSYRHRAGKLDDYTLHRRSAGMGMVMRRSSYLELGTFHEEKTNVGHQWCAAMRKKKYLFIHHPTWRGRHLCPNPSFHYKYQTFNPETGEWKDNGRNPRRVANEHN